MPQLKKTTIRLTEEDENLLEQLSQALSYRFGKAENMSQSEVIRYSLRQTAERELGITRQSESSKKHG